MLEAKISDLKSKLSAYLARVRKGETLVILDRQTPVARLVPMDGREGLSIHEATQAPKSLRRRSAVKVQEPVDVVAMLRTDRDQR